MYTITQQATAGPLHSCLPLPPRLASQQFRKPQIEVHGYTQQGTPAPDPGYLFKTYPGGEMGYLFLLHQRKQEPRR